MIAPIADGREQLREGRIKVRIAIGQARGFRWGHGGKGQGRIEQGRDLKRHNDSQAETWRPTTHTASMANSAFSQFSQFSELGQWFQSASISRMCRPRFRLASVGSPPLQPWLYPWFHPPQSPPSVEARLVFRVPLRFVSGDPGGRR